MLLALPVILAAQTLQPGDRIRIMREGRSPLVGRFGRLTADSVWLTPARQSQAVGFALGPTLRLDRSLGTHGHAGAGALVGAGVGALVAVFFLTAYCGGDNYCNGDEQVGAAALFGLPSLALGAGIGALIRDERWAPVARGLSGAALGIQLGVRVAW